MTLLCYGEHVCIIEITQRACVDPRSQGFHIFHIADFIIFYVECPFLPPPYWASVQKDGRKGKQSPKSDTQYKFQENITDHDQTYVAHLFVLRTLFVILITVIIFVFVRIALFLFASIEFNLQAKKTSIRGIYRFNFFYVFLLCTSDAINTPRTARSLQT